MHPTGTPSAQVRDDGMRARREYRAALDRLAMETRRWTEAILDAAEKAGAVEGEDAYAEGTIHAVRSMALAAFSKAPGMLQAFLSSETE